MRHEFCDHCPDCRPALLDIGTGLPMAEDNPVMIAVNKIWNNETTYDMRKAYIEVTLGNSQDKTDMLLASQFVSKIQQLIKSM
jgi:hypothetical protein